jgi:hypothetical protein
VQTFDAATTVFEVLPVLSDGRGSFVVLEILATLVMTVPSAVPAVTLTVSEKIARALTGRVAIVQLTVPPDGGEQLNAGPELCASDTKVVLAGIVSVTVTLCASSGPWLVTSIL